MSKSESKTTTSPDAIKQAAIFRDGEIWTLPRPARHHNILWAMFDVDNGKTPAERPALIPARGEQGFITYGGRFVDRRLAYVRAVENKQLIGVPSAPPKLYSEDIW